MFTNNVYQNRAPLQDISLQNLSDLEFDLSRPFKVKSYGATGLPIYRILILSNREQMCIAHHLTVTLPPDNISPISYHFGQYSDIPTHPYPWAIFFKCNSSISGSEGRLLLNRNMTGLILSENLY